MKNWIFWGTVNTDVHCPMSARVIHHIKRCKEPGRTKEYKNMMYLLDNYVYTNVGYMTADAWNKENQYIKMNAQPI
tara:strand:- start:1795 stop:2022 length:228 start_codon:yes stop_codon:yes gene_type:complete